MRSPRRRNRPGDFTSPTNQSRMTGGTCVAASPAADRRTLWISLALIAANVIVYAAVPRYDFVNFDDRLYVSENATVAAGLTRHGVVWAFTTGHQSNWHPLTWLSHMLDVQLFGMWAGGHHFTNLLLHLVNTLLLCGVLHRMTAAWGRSAFVAGLFAVHPLHVESVAWVAERKDVLSTLCWMFTLWSYVAYVQQPGRRRYALVILCFALGLLAKPMLVTLPFVLLLLDYWPLRRMMVDDAEPGDGVQRLHPGALLREKLPLIALAITSSIVTLVVQQRGGAVGGFDAFPLGLRLANALISYVAYILKMIWPVRLAIFYPYPRSFPVWQLIAAATLLIGASAGAVMGAKRRPYLLVGWLWYLATLVPVIGLVQVGGQAMADRYTYIPLIGLFVAFAWGAADIGMPPRFKRMVLTAAAGLLLVSLAITARAQVQHWVNSVALWQHASSVTRDNFFAHHEYGNALSEQGRVDEAFAQYSEAARVKPDFDNAHISLGVLLLNRGQLDQAFREFSEALRIKPDSPKAHNNLGVVLARQGKLTEAAVHHREALRLWPWYAEAHNNLGLVLVAEGKSNEAIAQFSETVHLKPGFAAAHHNLAMTLAQQGRLVEAISEMEEALHIQPDQALWHYNLAVLYQQNGNSGRAAHHLERALTLDPKNLTVQQALNSLKKARPH